MEVLLLLSVLSKYTLKSKLEVPLPTLFHIISLKAPVPAPISATLSFGCISNSLMITSAQPACAKPHSSSYSLDTAS